MAQVAHLSPINHTPEIIATEYLKPFHFSLYTSTSESSLHTMRFTSSSAFIASTIALLSLMTPVISADVAKITSPVGGQVFLGGVDSVQVQWYVV